MKSWKGNSSTLSLTSEIDGFVCQDQAPAALPPGLERVSLLNVEEAALAPGPVWTGAESFVPKGFRSPDSPALSESLYRLSYPDPIKNARLNFIYS